MIVDDTAITPPYFHQAIDATQLVHDRPPREAAHAPWQVRSDDSTSVRVFADALPAASSYTSDESDLGEEAAAGDAAFHQANEHRLALLIRKYAREDLALPTEHDVRLRMVTERVRELLPRVTASDYAAVEGVLTAMNEREARRAKRIKELGLEK